MPYCAIRRIATTKAGLLDVDPHLRISPTGTGHFRANCRKMARRGSEPGGRLAARAKCCAASTDAGAWAPMPDPAPAPQSLTRDPSVQLNSINLDARVAVVTGGAHHLYAQPYPARAVPGAGGGRGDDRLARQRRKLLRHGSSVRLVRRPSDVLRDRNGDTLEDHGMRNPASARCGRRDESVGRIASSIFGAISGANSLLP